MNQSIDYKLLFSSLPGRHALLEAKPPEYAMIDASNQYLQATGKTKEQIVGKSLFDLFPDTSEETIVTGKAELRTSLDKVVDQEEPDSTGIVRYDLIDENEAIRIQYWQATHYPIIEDGECVAILQSANDVDESVSVASHQLRTPATTVKQYVAMVLDGIVGDISDDQRELLRKAYESNERQLSIINKLLGVAHVDSGSFDLIQSQTNITELVKRAVDDFVPSFVEKDQHLILNELGEVWAMVDADAIRMVIDNLLENAVKYSEPEDTTTVTINTADSHLTITVADEGVGVGQPDRLFKKFSRISNSLSKDVGGTGLGLYWAQSIARMHDGDLIHKSNTPVGSQFILILPLVK